MGNYSTREVEALGEDIAKKFAFTLHRKIVENAPVDTGRLRNSFTVIKQGNEYVVGTNLEYAIYLELGTGIYGPKRRPIRPKRAKALHWIDRKTRKDVFATQVKGIKPMHYIWKSIMEAMKEFKGR